MKDNQGKSDKYEWDSYLDSLMSYSPGISVGNERYGNHGEKFLLTTDRFRHELIIGPSGGGKTTALIWRIMQDLNSGTRFVLCASGDVIKRVIALASKDTLANTVYIDYSDPDCKVCQNPFSGLDFNDAKAVSKRCEETVDFLCDDNQYLVAGPRAKLKLRLCFMTVADINFPHPRLIRAMFGLILDSNYRQSALKPIKSAYVINGWLQDEVAARSIEHGDLNQWVYAKSDILDTSALFKQVFSVGEATVNIEKLADKNVLLNIDGSVIGTKEADILRRYFTKEFHREIMSRSLKDPDSLEPNIYYFDELHEWVNDSFSELLYGCRKYRCGLVLSCQNLRQLTQYSRSLDAMNTELFEAILGNVGTITAFKLSTRDASVLAEEFEMTPRELRDVPAYTATCRLLLGGQMQKPVKVVTPLLEGDAYKENLAFLKEKMLQEGYWLLEDRADTGICETIEKDEMDPVYDKLSRSQSDRLLVRSYFSGASLDKQRSTVPSKLLQAKKAVALSHDSRSKKKNTCKGKDGSQADSKKASWGNVSALLEKTNLKAARMEVLSLLDMLEEAKGAEE